MPLYEIVPLFERAVAMLRNGHPSAIRPKWEALPEVAALDLATRDNIWALATVACAN